MLNAPRGAGPEHSSPGGTPVTWAAVEPDRQADIAALDSALTTVERVLDVDGLRSRIEKLEHEASDPKLWDDQANAQRVTSELSHTQGELRRIINGLLGDPDVALDPRLPEIRKKTDEVMGVFTQFDGSLENELDAVDQAAPNDKPAAKAKAVQTIDQYQNILASEPLLKEMERSPLGAASIYSELSTAITEIKNILSK